MADNLTTQAVTPATIPTASVIATDDVGGVHYQRVKLDFGGDGVSSPATPLATEATLDARTGALTETAPATDTASSGVNGRLQRIAQRLTSLIALLPGSLGQKAMAASLAVTVASDQSAVPVAMSKSSTSSAAAQTSQGTTAVQVLAANANRKQLIILNTGTTTIKLLLGAGTPTQTSYHVALRGAGAADDGSGGSYVSDVWTGAVQAISSGASGAMVITELT